jgi:hypothetical protein
MDVLKRFGWLKQSCWTTWQANTLLDPLSGQGCELLLSEGPVQLALCTRVLLPTLR